MSNEIVTAATTPPAGCLDWIKFYGTTMMYSGLPLFFWNRPKWTEKDMVDQRGKVVLITGGNSGTGYATAKAYYEHGATVYIACRSAERAQTAIADIKKGGSVTLYGKMVYNPATTSKPLGTVDYINLDLADLTNVEQCAAEFLTREKRLDILFANAGVMALPEGQFTKQGYSMQWGTNVLGHQRLISLLLPLLRSSSSLEAPSRLITLSSAAHSTAPPGGVDYDSLKKGGKILHRWVEYGESKWGDLALAKYVDAHYGPNSGTTAGQVIAIGVHPGLVASNLYTHVSLASLLPWMPWVHASLNVPTGKGALTQLWAAEVAVETARKLSGGYVAPYESQVAHRPDLTVAAADKVWEWCEQQSRRTK